MNLTTWIDKQYYGLPAGGPSVCRRSHALHVTREAPVAQTLGTKPRL